MTSQLSRTFTLLLLFALTGYAGAENWQQARREFARKYNSQATEQQKLEALEILAPHKRRQATNILLRVLQVSKSARIYNKAIEILSSHTSNSKSQDLIYRYARQARQIHVITALLQLLGNQQTSQQSLKLLSNSLKNKYWEIRLAAISSLGNIQEKKAISLLITHLSRERKGRLRQETVKSLQKLTTRHFSSNHQEWLHWWQANQTEFTFPQNPSSTTVRQEADQAVASQVSYYKYQIISNSLIFIIDTSGSMDKEIHQGTTTGSEKQAQTRLDLAKQELLETISQLPPDTYFTIISYSNDTRKWEKKLFPALARYKQEAQEFVENLSAAGATATYDALEDALAIREADTLFILTDGQPSGGKISQPDEILKAVADLNKGHNVKINSIGVALPTKGAKFLQKLSAQNNGRYIEVEE